MDLTTEDPIIEDQWIRNEYQWDRMSDVKWDILRNNLEVTDKILQNPQRFPHADFDAVATRNTQLFMFLSLHG